MQSDHRHGFNKWFFHGLPSCPFTSTYYYRILVDLFNFNLSTSLSNLVEISTVAGLQQRSVCLGSWLICIFSSYWLRTLPGQWNSSRQTQILDDSSF